VDWSPSRTDPNTGERVCRRVETRLGRSGRRLSGCLACEVTDREGRQRLVRGPFAGPVLDLPESGKLFQGAGSHVEMSGDYGGNPNPEEAAFWCFVLHA
jgi:hypothetical protein